MSSHRSREEDPATGKDPLLYPLANKPLKPLKPLPVGDLHSIIEGVGLDLHPVLHAGDYY